MADTAFAGHIPARKVYAAACRDLRTNIGHLKGLRAKLRHPQGSHIAAAAEEGAAEASQPGSSAVLRNRLADAVELLQDRLKQLEDSKPSPAKVSVLGGSLEQVKSLLASNKTGLDAVELHDWFVQLKEKRGVVLEAVGALNEAPATGMKAHSAYVVIRL